MPVSFHKRTVTSTVESAIPFAAADPTALANSANTSSRSGMSFADLCNAQISQSADAQAAAPATALPSNPSAQTGNRTANAPAPKNSAKNAAAAAGSPVLALLAPLPPVPLAVPVTTLTSVQTQAVESFLSAGSTNQPGSGSGGNIQSTNLAPAAGMATAPGLASENMSASGTATAIPSFAPSINSSPQTPPSPSAPAQDSWPLSSPEDVNPVSLSASAESPSSGSSSWLASETGTQNSILGSADVAGDPTPPGNISAESISATREAFAPHAEMTSPAPAAPEVSFSTPDTYSLVMPDNAEEEIPNQTPVAPLSPAVVETPSLSDAPEQNIMQAAAASSSPTQPPAPADPQAPSPSVTQPPSAPDQELSRSSSITKTAIPGTSAVGTSTAGVLPANAAAMATSLEAHAALQGMQPAATSPAQAHGVSSATTTAVAALPTMSAVQDNLNNAHPPANASVSASGTQAPAAGAASPSPVSSSLASASKKDTGGQSSDSDQRKDSPNAVATAADSLPTAPSPAFTLAAPSAQGNVPQPPSSPDSGPKSNPQTSAGSSANTPRASLPATADTPPSAGASPLQWAQMANKAGQAEMRIGLNTAEFGSVEVRTTVHASDVGVLIGSEKGDLRSLLTPELSGLASTLQQKDLRLAQVSFHQQGFDFAGNSSFSGGNSQPRSFSPRLQPAAASSEESSAPEPVYASEPAASRSGSGLSILA